MPNLDSVMQCILHAYYQRILAPHSALNIARRTACILCSHERQAEARPARRCQKPIGSASLELVQCSRAHGRDRGKANSFRARRFSTSSAPAATTWRKCCWACSSRTRRTRSAAIIARARSCLRWRCAGGRAGLGHGPRRRLFATGAISARCSIIPTRRRFGAADVRRRRRAIHAHRRLRAGDRVSQERAERSRAMTARSASCSAATLRWRPTASGPR